MIPRRKHWLISLSVILALVVLGGITVSRSQHEPVYQGKTVTEWIRDYQLNYQGGTNTTIDYCSGTLYWVGSPAPDALRHLGAAALPYLVAALRKDQGPIASGYERIYQKMSPPCQSLLPKPAPLALIQYNAKYGLRDLGEISAPAIPQLIELLASQDPSIRSAAKETLEALNFSPKAYEDSWNRLFATPLSNQCAVELIVEFVENRSPAIETALIKALEDPVAKVRTTAMVMLAVKSERNIKVIAAIGRRLRDPDQEIRIRAAEMLDNQEQDIARPALRDLEFASHDPIHKVQTTAKRILQRLENQSPATVLSNP